MPRIRYLRHHRDFMEASDGVSGLQILTNVSFDGDAPEAVRLNIASPNSSLRRSSQRQPFRRNKVPFEIHSPAILINSDQLAVLQRNFAAVHSAIGDRRLGTISIESPIHESILPLIQARSYEIIWIDSVLESLSLNSSLYQSYLQHPNALNLADQGVATTLISQARDASDLYSRLPELRSYADQDDVETEDIGPRGEQFRQWLQKNHTVANGNGFAMDFVAYALRPLRISGFQWHMGNAGDIQLPHEPATDLRRLTVDLLLRFEGSPIWCEVKARGDRWTSSALQQILLYGSMLCGANQMHRCRRYFADSFLTFQPWLGILVEDQDDPRFQADYEQALSLAQTDIFQNALGSLFGGMIFGMIQETPAGWQLSRSQVIRW